MPRPTNNPSNPICRRLVDGKCKYDDECRFYHPPTITRTIRKKTAREIGKCFCGAGQTKLMNKKRWRDEDDDGPLFFVVCARTKRSMKRCM